MTDEPFVLATTNPGKIGEMREVLSAYGLETISLAEIGINVDIEETGSTYIENASLKAAAICEASGLPSIADDSGLEVDALDGGPGVYSRRYGGGRLSDAEQCDYLLKNIKNTEQRSAKFVCIIVCAFPGGKIISAHGECSGSIAPQPCGTSGFGYDPIFFVNGAGKTMAELSPEEKNAISHRGIALRELAKKLSAIKR